MDDLQPLGRACWAELVGTYILVFFGIGSVHVAVLTGALPGLFQVAAVWVAGVTLAILTVAARSGAHINPAITVTMAVWRGFPVSRVGPYILFQVIGAFLAAATLYGIYSGTIAAFEAEAGLTRGAAGSELSAMVYGEYFPNPAIYGTAPEALAQVSLFQGMLGEAIGTFFLALFVFAMTDDRNEVRPLGAGAALAIGACVGMIICVIAPVTQAGLNPARDFGPRLWSLFAGWGSVAIPGPRGGFFTVYILAPIVGAVIAGAVHRTLHPMGKSGPLD